MKKFTFAIDVLNNAITDLEKEIAAMNYRISIVQNDAYCLVLIAQRDKIYEQINELRDAKGVLHIENVNASLGFSNG